MFAQQIIQGGFQGLGAFGDAASSGQALRGSIVDVVLEVNFANRVVGYTATLTRALLQRLNSSGFNVQNLDDSNLNTLTGGTIRARVQILTDGYSSARDAASVIAGAASALGYNVVGFTGVLAALPSGEATGGTGQTFDAGSKPENKLDASSLSGFFDSLTQSPVTLAVVAGATVLFVIAMKK